MLLILENQKLSIDQLKKRAFDPNIFSPNAKYVIEFIVSWLNETQNFQFQTSGSTGKPKEIQLPREVLAYSARQTLDRIGWPGPDTNRFLLCINPNFIGGTMVIVRALLADAELVVVPPSSDISVEGRFHLASMVPLQISRLLAAGASFEPFDHVLIGGGSLDPKTEKQLTRFSTKFYHTYGMTETASHVALRPIGQPFFEALGDANFRCQEDGTLEIAGTVTSHLPLSTTDIVKLKDPKTFTWLGRKDFVINTGGVKVQPEKIEAALADQLSDPFVVAGIPDPLLGQKVVLIAGGGPRTLNFDKLHPYERPKEVFFQQEIHLTSTGKTDRHKTFETLLKSLHIDH